MCYFKSPEHQQRLRGTLQALGKIINGNPDAEYASALYILAADLSTWKKASAYISDLGIDFEALLEDVDFSSGYAVLIHLAGNLFNESLHIDPIQFLQLDPANFIVALTAIQVRRNPSLVMQESMPKGALN